MPKPVVVTISHTVSRQEAIARLRERLGMARQMLGDYKIVVLRDQWTDNRLDFAVGALGQNAQGLVEVMDDHFRIELQLPWLLAAFAERIAALVQKKAPLLLGHDVKKADKG